ncbi:MAG: hypothetical protein ABIR39_07480 [Nocardioides sp.]|uniref:WXG100 family type VII secretion target n=1 Tax=Nocardioides sp. TaxID=35761 RepID=UPI003263E898
MAVETFDDLLREMDTLVTAAVDALFDAADKAGDALEDAAGLQLDDFLPGENEAEKALDKWNEEIRPKLDEQINSVRDNVQAEVDKLLAYPADLMDYAEDFIAAKGIIDASSTLNQDVKNLMLTWSGSAAAQYETVAGEQSDGLSALAKGLQSGGVQTDNSANRIITFYLDLINTFEGFRADALAVIGGYADVGKALGGWISSIADTIALIWKGVFQIATDLGKYWAETATVEAGAWATLSTGVDGLPDNRWPVITEESSDGINNPGNWPN